ncbi:hypothetical protein GCM10010261_00470 [Streptomyces pilosus]|uniref:Uncharacterized protein n=1 Tax=Streptomyces pilosus TaxID=28893 RepID=A0A918F444_9ACTN|nr:hypothetical protein GCM10010280_62150 [Streptomyces pilosus]GGV32822.1 hypothetical protein GCM10010261_00470 [Streptomyces pilosus]
MAFTHLTPDMADLARHRRCGAHWHSSVTPVPVWGDPFGRERTHAREPSGVPGSAGAPGPGGAGYRWGGGPSMGRPSTPGRRCQGSGPVGGR